MSLEDLYCSLDDVGHRVPVGALRSLSGIAATSLATSNRFTYDGHGLTTGTPITVRAVEGGSAISAPLVEGTTYYVRRINNASFELAATVGGPAIDLTSNAVDVMLIREPDFDYWISFYSRWADSSLPAHIVPLPTPLDPNVYGLVSGLVADLVAKRMFNVGGQESETLKDIELASKSQLERFAKGLPIRNTPGTSSANLSVTTSLGSTSDPRGWGSGTLP